MVTFLTLHNPPPAFWPSDSSHVTSDTRNGLLIFFAHLCCLCNHTGFVRLLPGAFRDTADMQAVGMDISRTTLEGGSALRVNLRRTGKRKRMRLSVGSRWEGSG